MNKFQRARNVADEERSPWSSTAQDIFQAVEDAIHRRPTTAARKLLGDNSFYSNTFYYTFLYTTVRRTLRYKLKKRRYQVQVVHHVKPEDLTAREAMYVYLLESVANENVLFGDVTTFHTCKSVNRHNYRI